MKEPQNSVDKFSIWWRQKNEQKKENECFLDFQEVADIKSFHLTCDAITNMRAFLSNTANRVEWKTGHLQNAKITCTDNKTHDRNFHFISFVSKTRLKSARKCTWKKWSSLSFYLFVHSFLFIFYVNKSVRETFNSFFIWTTFFHSKYLKT